MWTALLGAGAGLLGGAIGQSQQSKSQKRALWQAQKQFDAQMDESVQRRVKDAKAAGIHPLFALGASSGASPTITTDGQSAGPNPMQSALTAMARQLGVIESNHASAKRDEAEAALLDSQRKRIELDLLGPSGNDAEAQVSAGVTTFPLDPDTGRYLGPVEYYKPEIPHTQPGRPGTSAGRGPAYKEFQRDDGSVIRLYNEDLQADEIGQVWLALQETGNKGRQFANWLKQKGLTVTRPKGTPHISVKKTQSRKNYDLYRRNGGTLTWKQWKKEGN